MSTPTDLQAAVRKTLTSRAFERFIGLAVSNAMEAQDDSLRLAAPRLRHVTFFNSSAGMYGLQQPGSDVAVRMFLRRANEEGYRAPGWYGSEIRWDKYGREWERSFGPLVCDDFGELVEVAQ